MNQAKNTIRLLETLKIKKDNLTAGSALGFAAQTMELIKKSVGEQSEQYRLMKNLLYDQTAAHLEYTYYPADAFIVIRAKMSGQFDSVIDTCIDFVRVFGIYKPPSDKKNVLGDLDNSILWALIGFIVTTSFLAGVVVTNYGLSKLSDSNANADKVRLKFPKEPEKDTLRLDPLSKNHNATKGKPR